MSQLPDIEAIDLSAIAEFDITELLKLADIDLKFLDDLPAFELPDLRSKKKPL